MEQKKLFNELDVITMKKKIALEKINQFVETQFEKYSELLKGILVKNS
jgi:hypothetical protein